MNKSSRSSRTLWLGLSAGAVGGFLVGRRLAAPRHMPHLSVWQREMAKSRGQVQASMLAARVQRRYDELYASRPQFAARILRVHLEMIILPGLALYQILCEDNDDQEAVVAEVETLIAATFGRFGRVMSLLNTLPDSWTVFRAITRQTLRLGFPPQGWHIEPVQDDEHCIAFDYHRCFYLDVLRAYEVPELAPVYCKMDDMLYESLPSAIVWERRGTLASGAECCDFRWCWEPQAAE